MHGIHFSFGAKIKYFLMLLDTESQTGHIDEKVMHNVFFHIHSDVTKVAKNITITLFYSITYRLKE